MANPFDYITSISFSKEDMMQDELGEKEYNAFMVNRGLSYFPDTIMYANKMNMLAHVDKKLQYQYLINSIRPRKRFSKWAKRKDDVNLQMVMEYFGYSIDKAQSALSILSPNDLDKIKQKMKEINSEGNIVYIVEMLETFYFLVRFLIIICMNASAIFFFNFLEIFLLEWLTSFRLNFSCLEHLQVQSITYIVLGRTLYGYIIYFLHIYLKSFLL